jgi:glycosyltransferase involved in cell wall biosynthesis
MVDRNSALYQRLVTQHQNLEVIPNKFERGLSGARNTGIDQAKGDVVVFLDDDAYAADPRWLQSLLACYDDESVLGAGGLVLPDWARQTGPAGCLRNFRVVGCSYQGLPDTKAEVRNPVGVNMSFRRTSFDRAGYFDSSVGRNAKVTRLSAARKRSSVSGCVGYGMSSALSSERAYVIHAVRQAFYREFLSLLWYWQQGCAGSANRPATRRFLDSGRICRGFGEP